MKKIVLLMMSLLFLPLAASAYQVYIDAPESLTIGKPLVVTGSTTFGIGTPIDVVLYRQLTTTSEVKRKIVYIQTDKTFKTVFDTTNLPPGTYKVEVPTNGMGDSITMRVVQLIDRSDSIHLNSPLMQSFSGKMTVTGSIKGGENSGIQVEVIGPDNVVVFGPRYVNTNNAGDFSVELPISRSGDYEVSFTDAKGYIGAKTITISGEPSVSQQPAVTSTPELNILSAHTSSSRENPAFFFVQTGIGPGSLYTSASTDWVIEYADDNGIRVIVNNFSNLTAEKMAINQENKSLYIMVYPEKPGVSVEAFLYGQNVRSLAVSTEIPPVFSPTASVPEDTPSTSLLPLTAIVATCVVVIFLRRSL